MKVVFLTSIPAPYRVAFFNEWGKICDLTVIFERKASADRDDSWKNVDVRNFKAVFLKGVNYKSNKAFCPGVVKTIKSLDYDVFIIGGYNTPTAMMAAGYLKRNHIPYILNADGGYVKKNCLIVNRIKRHFISAASMWTCSSDKTKEYFVYYGAKEEMVRKYPFTSLYKRDILEKPVSPVEKEKCKKLLNIPEKTMVMSVGQFIRRKGFDVLLRAKKKLPAGTGLYIIGGNETQEYKKIVEDLGLSNVHFIPFMKPDELARYYMAADIFVLPTREDIWGLVVNEAAAKGLPIVTTDNCIAGVEMIEDGKNGFIVPSEDEDAIADRVNRLLSDSDLSLGFSENILSAAQRYTFEEMARMHETIAEEFLSIYEGN